MRISIEGATIEEMEKAIPVEFSEFSWHLTMALRDIEKAHPNHRLHTRLSMENVSYMDGYEFSLECTLSKPAAVSDQKESATIGQ